MVKTANAISKLQKAGATVEKVSPTRYVAYFSSARVEISDQDGYASSLYVSKKGQRDDIQSDYFPGTFKDTIKGAIELAQRMATW